MYYKARRTDIFRLSQSICRHTRQFVRNGGKVYYRSRLDRGCDESRIGRRTEEKEGYFLFGKNIQQEICSKMVSKITEEMVGNKGFFVDQLLKVKRKMVGR